MAKKKPTPEHEAPEISDYLTTAEPKAWADEIPVFCAHDAIVKTSELKPNPKNPNQHPPEQVKLLGAIIRGQGWRGPITISNRSGMIVRGHGRLMAAQLEDLAEVPVDYQNYSSEAEEMADLVADNRIAELSDADTKMLANIFADIDTGEIPFALSGYTEEEYGNIVSALSEALHTNELEDPDAVIEPPAEPVTQYGDPWILGRHRVMCGDCVSEKDRNTLLGGATPEILITDPPYCSGGFQEAGRSKGSIGTDRVDGNLPTIANDTLSTRGYQALMKQALLDLPVVVAYIFTDWRMWVYLFDIVESSGLGVKNMIVWNKKSSGMGVGWRTQHELVMFAHRTKAKFDNHKGYGNVLECKRTGNELHPTQKPTELIGMIIDNTLWASGVYDPFGGSGTTLIACEEYNQPSYIMELTPAFTDVIVRRYIRTTGKQNIKCIRNGQELPREAIERIFSEEPMT